MAQSFSFQLLQMSAMQIQNRIQYCFGDASTSTTSVQQKIFLCNMLEDTTTLKNWISLQVKIIAFKKVSFRDRLKVQISHDFFGFLGMKMVRCTVPPFPFGFSTMLNELNSSSLFLCVY